jgi:murein DD-endopeptidase MepM/ murein hydrolase activator NlpD
MKKGISIVVSSTGSGNSRHIFLPSIWLKVILAGAIIAGLVVIVGILNYAALSYRALEAEILKKRNAEIEFEFSKLQEIKRNLEIAEADNQKLKFMLGIEKSPVPVEPVTEKTNNIPIVNADTLKEKENIPSLLPTIGQISKRFDESHTGIDIAAPIFSPVISAASGTVTAAGWDSIYGNYVMIEHSKNYSTFYGHCNTVAIKKDDMVTAGQIIGTVGSSGKSTSPHLHYEVHFKDNPVDPMAYLPSFIEK